ncbi:MAG: hypothetical protein KJO40_05775 [Deltaproteobacteria bacterium]|nr:hypothetical protein [Deltaproteobacteria bacterium]NND27777.1 hypothetical protein [Myxococcales bacterium]NNK06116.1 hypothetical protein [Myxococcales bacterium]RZV53062.1 MAG: hypothetical protein EX268_10310 [Deltaproteobacteria bacterium]
MKDDFQVTYRKVLLCFLMSNVLGGFPLDASAQEASGETAQEHRGVPLEPIEIDSAVDAVQASVAKIQALSKSGIAATHRIEFGDDFDWVQLVSGEWIKGEIKRMRDEKLEFDSDKLDMLNIDFNDVALVHTPRIGTYVFDGRVSESGNSVIIEDKVIINTHEGTKVFPRSELQSIVEGGEREKDWWWFKLGFGLTLNKGNTDQFTVRLHPPPHLRGLRHHGRHRSDAELAHQLGGFDNRQHQPHRKSKPCHRAN